jgi:RNA polymerase sigma-70 factor (ECF subfamily)
MHSASGRPDPETAEIPGTSGGSASTHPDPPERLDELVQTQIDFVWRVLRRLGLSRSDAQDAAQQVFLVASRRLPQLERGKERSFLYGTAVRMAANLRRSFRRRREAPEADLPASPAGQPLPDELVEQQRARAFLDELLGQLPDELRRVLVLAEIEQLTLAAIAELESIPAGTAASRLRRAREAFRRLLAAERHRNPFDRSEP